MRDFSIEYSIYRITNGGCPYVMNSYKTLMDAKQAIDLIVNSHEQRKRMYYIDNDYYNNKYKNFGSMKNFYYYKIVCRRVEEWHGIEDITEEENNQDNKLIYYNF